MCYMEVQYFKLQLLELDKPGYCEGSNLALCLKQHSSQDKEGWAFVRLTAVNKCFVLFKKLCRKLSLLKLVPCSQTWYGY